MSGSESLSAGTMQMEAPDGRFSAKAQRPQRNAETGRFNLISAVEEECKVSLGQ